MLLKAFFPVVKPLELWESMEEKHFIEEDVYIAIIRLCEWKRACDKGTRFHFHILNSKTHLRLWLGNELLSILVKFGNHANA